MMNPVLIYFREVPFTENKFVLDFSNENHVQPIEFKRNTVYYIATLDCKLKLKELVQESEDIKKLYAKSKILNDQGSDHFCDIDFIDLVTPPQFRQPFSSNDQYKFERTSKNIENYSYRHKFWDLKEKKIKNGKIYSPYSQLIAKSLICKKTGNTGFSDMTLVTQLNKKSEKLQSSFLYNHASNKTEYLNYSLGENYYRDINLFFVYNARFKQWQLFSQPEFFREAIYAKVTAKNFNEKEFARKYYDQDKKADLLLAHLVKG